MDATQYGESDFITAEIVKASKSKKCVIVGDAKIEDTDYGMKLELPVEIDGKKKRFRPNKDTVKNLIGSWTPETKAWLGKAIDLQIISIQGKDSVIGTAGK